MSEPEKTPPPSVRDYLLYSLSIPERALRTTVGAAGGAAREAATLLVPQAFQDSKTYSTLVRETLDFMTKDIGRVRHPDDNEPENAAMDDFVARKTVGGFVDMAGLATLHVSPVMLLAIVSDVAYGTQSCLRELAAELKQDGVIDENSTIDSASDFLNAIGNASGVATSSFNAPPISVEGLRAMIDETRSAVGSIDPASVLPQAEVKRMWNEMREVATRDEVGLLGVSSAVTLHSLDRVANVGRGALSPTRAVGRLFDRAIINHYRVALADVQRDGVYATLAKTSGPYVEAVWTNFSSTSSTITEDLLTGRLMNKASAAIGAWWGEKKLKDASAADKPSTDDESNDDDTK